MKSIRMNIQYFAEGGDGGSGAEPNSSVASQHSNSSANSSGSSSAAPSSSAKSYSEDYVKRLIEDNKSQIAEVEKKAKMTAAEKSKYEQDKAQRELDDLKKKNATYEMRDTARSLANDMGFSATADDIKFAAAADVDTTKSHLNYLKSVYDRGAEATKKEYLTGKPVHKTGQPLSGNKKKESREDRLKKNQRSANFWNNSK